MRGDFHILGMLVFICVEQLYGADYYIYFVGVINDNILIVMIWVSDAMQEWSQLQEVELIWPNTFYVEETIRQFKYYSPFIYLHLYPQM